MSYDSGKDVVTRDVAAQVRDAVVDAIDPLEIILFGSLAHAATGRDLDLLVVTDDEDGLPGAGRNATLRSVLRPLRRTFDIDDMVVTRSHFAEHLRRGSPFVRKIVSEGICIYMREGTKAWRQQADEERNTAAYLRSGGFYRGACYHAQQCVENSIKTMLLEVGWEMEKIHGIHRLAAIAEDYHAPLPLSPDDIDFVDAIYRGRYPAESGLLPLGDPTEADAERAVAVATKSLGALTTFLASRKQVEDTPDACATDPPDSSAGG